MGRRSRKRATTAAPTRDRAGAPVAPPAPPRVPDRRARMDEAPKAPWSPFPLNELCILIALVLMIWGFFTTGDRRGVLIACGITLITLSAGELAVREHFAGFRSHSGLLAGICAILASLPLYYLTSLPQAAILAGAVAVFAGAFTFLRRAFMRRSGGLGFRA